jgi:hypothetical protein
VLFLGQSEVEFIGATFITFARGLKHVFHEGVVA